MSRLSKYVLLALSFVSTSLASRPAHAQKGNQASQQEPPPSTLEDLEAVPIAAIPMALADLKVDLQRMKRGLGEIPLLLKRTKNELGTLKRDIRAMKKAPELRSLSRLSPRSLEDLHGAWLRKRHEGQAIEEQLRSAIEDESKQIQVIERRKKPWQLALEELVSEAHAPAVLQQRARTALVDLEATHKAIAAQRAALIGEQARVVDTIQAIDRVLERFHTVVQDVREELLARQALPIWQALRQSSRQRDTQNQWKNWIEDLRRTGRQHLHATQGYLDDEFASFVVQLLLFAVLVVVMSHLRSIGSEVRSKNIEQAHYTQALRHPLAAAALVTLFLTESLHADLPVLVLEAAGLLSLIPLLVVIPPLLPGVLRRGFRLLIPLFVLESLGDITVEGGPATRVIAFAVPLLAGILLASLRRRLDDASLKNLSDFALGALRLLISAASAALVAAGILSALGYTALSSLIADGTFASCYSALVLFSGAFVAQAIWVLGLHTALMRRLRAVRSHRRLLRRRGIALAGWIATLLWLSVSLERFQVDEILVRRIIEALERPRQFGGLEFTLESIGIFFVSIGLAILTAKTLRFVLDKELLPRTSLPRGVPDAISTLTGYTVVVLGVLGALRAAGINLDKIGIVLGGLGVGIGFGLQNLVNNFASGLILVFERPIQLGDTVQFSGGLGTVKHIGVRSSRVRTFQGAELIVPNAQLLEETVTNWTLSDRNRRIDIGVGVAYGTAAEKVIALLIDVARAHELTTDKPEPQAFLMGYGDSSVDFELRVWTERSEDWVVIASDLRVAIYNALAAAAIEIPFPQRDITIKSVAGSSDPTAEHDNAPNVPIMRS